MALIEVDQVCLNQAPVRSVDSIASSHLSSPFKIFRLVCGKPTIACNEPRRSTSRLKTLRTGNFDTIRCMIEFDPLQDIVNDNCNVPW